MGFVLNSMDMSESIAQGLLEKAMIREVAQRIALMVSSLPRVDYGNPYQRVPMANSTNPCSSRSKQRQVFFFLVDIKEEYCNKENSPHSAQ